MDKIEVVRELQSIGVASDAAEWLAPGLAGENGYITISSFTGSYVAPVGRTDR